MKNINNLFIQNKNGQIIVEHFDSLNKVFDVAKNEIIDCFCLIFDKDLKLTFNLRDPQARCDVKCLYLGVDNQSLNIDILVNHEVSNTTSKQSVKGILQGKARACFHGLISIKKDAQNADGYQNHRALLLSDDAIVKAVPELEIYADDVKCAHGSAVGPLDANSLFYLMSRGIKREEAEKMLIHAFLADFINPEYLNYCQDLIEEWLIKYV